MLTEYPNVISMNLSISIVNVRTDNRSTQNVENSDIQTASVKLQNEITRTNTHIHFNKTHSHGVQIAQQVSALERQFNAVNINEQHFTV